MSVNSQRTSLRTPVIIGFSLVLAAVSVMGINVFLDFEKVSKGVEQTRYESSYRYTLQEMLLFLDQAEMSVYTFALTQDPRELEAFYISEGMRDRRVEHLLELVPNLTIKGYNDDLIREVDKMYNLMYQVVGAGGQKREMNLYFKGLADSAQLAGRDSLWPEEPDFGAILRTLMDTSRMTLGLPEVQVDPEQDSVTLSSESFFNLQLFQNRNLAEFRRISQEITATRDRIQNYVFEIDNRLVEMNGSLISSVRKDLNDTSRFFTIFSVAVVLLGLAFLAYIIYTLDSNRRLQEELQEETARAEKLAKAKEEFLANMSHEIRTPMNAVIGFADQLNSTPLNPLQQRLLAPLRNSAKYLLALINDILDISKLDAGHFRLESRGFRMQSITQEVYDIFHQQAEKKGLTFSCEADDALPEILVGDPIRLKQILYNLVSNALKFTEEGTVTLKAMLAEGPDSGGMVQVSFEVRDTGIGIPPEKREDIFSKFIQAEDHTARKYGGTGLGLAITKRLTELQGGHISLESEVGKGTVVRILIPYGTGSNHDLHDEWDGKALDPSPLSGKHVLLVDDEIYNRELAQHILQKWNMPVTAVANGQAALEALRDEPSLSLILMDLQMPVMNGVEATQHIRQQLKNDIPILAMTATTTPAKLGEAREAGMNGYLSKPFRENELLSTLLSLLDLPKVLAKTQPVKPGQASLEAEGGYSRAAVLEMANQDEAFMLRMLSLFVNRSGEHITAFEQAAKIQDWKTLSMEAHKLIPQTRHLGLDGLAASLKSLEQDIEAGKKPNPARTGKILAQLKKLVAEIAADIEEMEKKA